MSDTLLTPAEAASICERGRNLLRLVAAGSERLTPAGWAVVHEARRLACRRRGCHQPATLVYRTSYRRSGALIEAAHLRCNDHPLPKWNTCEFAAFLRRAEGAP